MDEVRLVYKAATEIKAMADDKQNVTIEGYLNDTLTEEHCYDDCKNKIIRIVFDIND